MRVLSWNVPSLRSSTKSDWALDNWECCMVAVYAPFCIALRRELWVRLLEVICASWIPCCLGGDFNEVWLVTETKLEKKMHVKEMDDEWCLIPDENQACSFVEKLGALKVFLRRSNREFLGNVDLQIEATTILLNEFDERGARADEEAVIT
ncbi:hypothetical protein V6N13_030115 [Hibiscus sabdariffa]